MKIFLLEACAEAQRSLLSIWDQTWGRSVLPTVRSVGAMGTREGKSGKFLYILRSSDPRRVQRQQCYTTYWDRSCCKKTTVPYLLIRPLHFTGGKNQRLLV